MKSIAETNVGPNLTGQTSPRVAILIFNNLSGFQVLHFLFSVMGCHLLGLLSHYCPALFNGQLQKGLTLDERDRLLRFNRFV